jgi:hypothetical protein
MCVVLPFAVILSVSQNTLQSGVEGALLLTTQYFTSMLTSDAPTLYSNYLD